MDSRWRLFRCTTLENFTRWTELTLRIRAFFSRIPLSIAVSARFLRHRTALGLRVAIASLSGYSAKAHGR
jgi:hypothetical protein